MYKQIKNPYGQVDETTIKRISDNMFIPFDPMNNEYREYLKWLAEGNTPEPADE